MIGSITYYDKIKETNSLVYLKKLKQKTQGLTVSFGFSKFYKFLEFKKPYL